MQNIKAEDLDLVAGMRKMVGFSCVDLRSTEH
uniref:Uncharacterized protein n=1 Tax=Vitis vinifera TaxID=29760 RepID=F6HP14_VITVI